VLLRKIVGQVSTLDAASSGVASAENLPAELMQEIVAAENLLKRRLAIGSKMSERRLWTICKTRPTFLPTPRDEQFRFLSKEESWSSSSREKQS
jgi:hypothetical protein